MFGLYILLNTTNLIIDFSHVGQLEALKREKEEGSDGQAEGIGELTERLTMSYRPTEV